MSLVYPIQWESTRIHGYYYEEDMAAATVPLCGGQRFQLPDGDIVTITRKWCNLPRMTRAEMTFANIHFVSERPDSDHFVADLTHATLIEAHIRRIDPSKNYYRGMQAGWQQADKETPIPTPLQRLVDFYAQMMLFNRIRKRAREESANVLTVAKRQRSTTRT